MTTLTITLTSVCSGGNHLTFSTSGAASLTTQEVLASLLDPITDDDITSFCKVIAKMAKQGRTLAQARNLLQAGVTVTI